MLEDFLQRNNLFYSDSMDLTTNMQKTFASLEGKITDNIHTIKNTCILLIFILNITITIIIEGSDLIKKAINLLAMLKF